MANEDTPIYNLKAVVRETGLKPDTLRAWERRYSLPEPNRTGGGHRLYSQHDINTLKWLLARQEEGMSISRAVSLWRSLQAEGRDPLQVNPIEAVEEPAAYNSVELGNTVVELRRNWIDACLAFDERRAEHVLNQAFSYYSPEIVCFELLQKALVEIGNGWYVGEVSVQQEHFASALAMRRLDSLLAASPAPTRPGRIMVGCPPGDIHTFSPLLLTFLLRRRGWDIVYLGADVPTNRLAATIEKTRPDLAVFSAQLLDTAASLLDVAHYLREIGVPLAFGGYIFSAVPNLSSRIPGHFLGEELNKVPYVIEQLMLNPPPPPEFKEVSPEYLDAWAYFRERAGMIEAHVWQHYGRAYRNGAYRADERGYGDARNDDQGSSDRRNGDRRNGDHADVNQYLTRNILSALRLGDLDYIGSNLEWVEGMMINHDMPPHMLHSFLAAYRDAAAHYLDEPAGQIVIDWLDDVVAISALATGNPERNWPAAA